MKKLFLILAILFLIEAPTLLDISIIDAAPEKSAGADHSTKEQPAPATKEGASELSIPAFSQAFTEEISAHLKEQESPISIDSVKANKQNGSQGDDTRLSGEATTASTGSKSEECSNDSHKNAEENASDDGKIPALESESVKNSNPAADPEAEATHTEKTVDSPAHTSENSARTSTAANTEGSGQTAPKTRTEGTVSTTTKSGTEGTVPTTTKSGTKDTIPTTTEEHAENSTKTTQTSTEAKTEVPACKHTWTWATHTETKHIPEVSHEVPIYDDGWDEAVTVRKIYCPCCKSIYEDLDDYYDRDPCLGNFGHITVIDHYIHHEPELLYYDTIVDEPAHDEPITVKDYQYCPKCGERK